ncbi:ATP-binding cassette domain-containing protein [Actinokineospora sp. PR83]|uniref:ATP-binding cassette domain-containing protein n=1 Tax=Actinokineospora sp. PR83 TaxID=2884908 RepID=UPI0027E11F21|nr:ATP-binding cassette domain-containing protein [Actinokineospora sp. PR83]MCG8914791.1 ATP-binding cassette domain-containing protein [Actinokineospora sp. PR83]
MDNAIEAEGLRKAYGGHQALRGVDLAVPRGTVLGVLGPNGAGKTTTVRILATLLTADAGTARVAGHDVRRHPGLVRSRIGLTGQYAALDDKLTGRENLRLVGVLHHLGRARARAVADELLESFELADAADRPVKGYSGGMRRRLDLAASLVAEPEVLFLDEPTTGLDPHSRNTLWKRIRAQVDAGVTVLLTTQYLEEADQLADRVVVVDAGRVVAEGTPDQLKRKVGGERLSVTLVDPADSASALSALAGVGTDAPVRQGERVVQVSLAAGIGSIADAATALAGLDIAVEDFGVRRPSLDDVFLALTGHGATA